jgi:hypothetical protein
MRVLIAYQQRASPWRVGMTARRLSGVVLFAVVASLPAVRASSPQAIGSLGPKAARAVDALEAPIARIEGAQR